MKAKLFLLISMLFLTLQSSEVHAENPFINGIKVNLRVEKIKVGGVTGTHPRSPIQAPDVYLDDHTLYFAQEFEDNLVVSLEDENEVEVYSTYLYAGQTQLSLPSSLSGDYTLYIYKGNFAFIGEISLE